MCFIEIASCKKKVVSSKYGGMVAMVKDCKFLNLGFRFIRRNKIYKAKINKKKLKLYHLDRHFSHAENMESMDKNVDLGLQIY